MKKILFAVMMAFSLGAWADANCVGNAECIGEQYNTTNNTNNLGGSASAVGVGVGVAESNAHSSSSSGAIGIGGGANVDVKNTNSNVAVGGQGGKGGDGGLGVGIGVGGAGGNSAAVSKGGAASAKTGDVNSTVTIGGSDIDYPKIAPSAIAPGAYSATVCPIVTPSTKAMSVFFMSLSGTTGVTINGICAAYHEKDYDLVHQIACDEDSGYRRAMKKLGRECKE